MNAEQRVEKLEQDRDGIVESEKLLLKMARYHRIGLQELGARIDLDTGDVRERFDIIERKVDTIERMMVTIERMMVTKQDIAELKATQTDHSKRFDRLEATLAEILARLPKPGE